MLTHQTELGVADGIHEGVVARAGLGQQSGQGGNQGGDASVVTEHTLGDDTRVRGRCVQLLGC